MRMSLPHFSKNTRGSDASKSPQGRGDSAAIREITRRGRRPVASLCGNPVGFADESGGPDRCFRESPRRPRAQSKVSPQRQISKGKGGKVVTLHSRVARGKFCCGLGVRAVRAGSIGRGGQRIGESIEPPQDEAGGLGPAPSTKKSLPHGSKRTVRTSRPGNHFAFPPDLNPSGWPPVTEWLRKVPNWD